MPAFGKHGPNALLSKVRPITPSTKKARAIARTRVNSEPGRPWSCEAGRPWSNPFGLQARSAERNTLEKKSGLFKAPLCEYARCCRESMASASFATFERSCSMTCRSSLWALGTCDSKKRGQEACVRPLVSFPPSQPFRPTRIPDFCSPHPPPLLRLVRPSHTRHKA